MKSFRLGFCAVVLLAGFAPRSEAATVTWTMGSEATDDVGLGSAISVSGSFSSVAGNAFATQPGNTYNTYGTDPDGGCDGDAFANFGGQDATGFAVKTCGDVLMLQGAAAANQDVTSTLTLTNLSAMTSFKAGSYPGKGTGLEFHVEDSAGPNNQTIAGNLSETGTINGTGFALSIPYTITFGSNGDSLTIGSFDDEFCYQACNGTGAKDAWVSSPGTQAMGSTSTDDDDWAFETTLMGCVTFSNPGANTICTSNPTTAIIPFKADDPPLADEPVPEPGSLAILGTASGVLALLRRRRRG